MAWDDIINALEMNITDMLIQPESINYVTDIAGGPITIPANKIVELKVALREPSTEVPEPTMIYVNTIKYTIVDQISNLVDNGNTVFVNWAGSKLQFADSEVGKQITSLPCQHWGSQARAKNLTDAYNAVKALRDVGKAVFDDMAVNVKRYLRPKANNLTQLTQLYPPGQYAGADGEANGEMYYASGGTWKKYEAVSTSDPVPQVTAVDPAPGTVGVSSDYDPVVTFNENMSYADVSTKIRIIDEADDSTVTTTKQYLDRDGNVIASPETSMIIRKVKLVTANNLGGDLYTIEVLPCENIGGRVMAQSFTSQFSCAADMLPTPAQSSVVNGTITGTSVQLQLDSPGSDFEGPVHYAIMARDVSGTDPNIGATFQILTGYEALTDADFPKTVTDLTLSSNYEFIVRTLDNAAQYQDSNVMTVNTLADAVPPAPTPPTVTGLGTTGYTAQLLTANQVTDPDNPGATITYDIADGTTANIVATGKTGTQMNTGVAITASHSAGTNVNVYVRAVSSTSGAGPWSAATIVTVPTHQVPTAPTVGSLTTGNGTATLSVTGTSTFYEGSTYATYRWHKRVTGTTEWISDGSGASPHTYNGLTNGSPGYDFCAETEDSMGGVSAKSNLVSGTPSTGPLATITISAPDPSTIGFGARGTVNTNGGPNVTSYKIAYGPASTANISDLGTVTVVERTGANLANAASLFNWVDATLSAGNHKYWLSANNGNGYGAWSAEQAFTVLNPLFSDLCNNSSIDPTRYKTKTAGSGTNVETTKLVQSSSVAADGCGVYLIAPAEKGATRTYRRKFRITTDGSMILLALGAVTTVSGDPFLGYPHKAYLSTDVGQLYGTYFNATSGTTQAFTQQAYSTNTDYYAEISTRNDGTNDQFKMAFKNSSLGVIVESGWINFSAIAGGTGRLYAMWGDLMTDYGSGVSETSLFEVV